MGSAGMKHACAAATQPSRVVKKIGPQQPGAQRWARLFGGRLVCVRYRESVDKTQRFVTVELVVDQRPPRWRGDESTGVRIERSETDLRQRAKAAGAQFDWSRRLWIMPRRMALALGMSSRIVGLQPKAVPRASEKCLDMDISGDSWFQAVQSI